MTVKPAPSIAARLGVGSSNARSGPTIRRRSPEVRVQQHRQVPGAEPPGQAVQAHHVVEVAVAEHDRLERVRRDRQPVEVADQPVRGDAGVEEHPAGRPPARDLDQRREPVLGAQEVDGSPVQRPTRRARTGSGPAVPPRPHRRTSPSSGSSASDELSISVVTCTPSTGARLICCTSQPRAS